MNDLTISFIVILITVLFAGLVLVLTGRRRRQKAEAVKQMAASHGWHYEPIKDSENEGFAIQGVDWRFESITSTSANQSNRVSISEKFPTCWSTTSVRSENGLVLIGPKVPSIDIGNLGNILLQQVLHMFLGDEADQINEITEVHMDRPALENKISVWAASEEAALRFLTFNVENTLLNWKMKELPVVKITSKGIAITLVNGSTQTPEEILAVIDLGLTFLRG